MLNHKKPIDAEKRKKKFINADSSLKKYASDESASTSLDASANFFFNIVANATSRRFQKCAVTLIVACDEHSSQREINRKSCCIRNFSLAKIAFDDF